MATISENLQTLKTSVSAIKQAISDKGGDVSGDISTWANAIGGLSGGSSSSSLSPNDVNFYDCDGTLLHSYSASEIASMSQLPELPTREGLTCQGWTHTIDDITEYVNMYKRCDVGALYITDNGKTRLYINILDKADTSITIKYYQNQSSGVSIDWGDNTSKSTQSSAGNKTVSHTYSKPGKYCIQISVNTGAMQLGYGSSYNVFGEDTDSIYPYSIKSSMLERVEIGNKCTTLQPYCFSKCYNLKSITIPNNINLSDHCFEYCSSLKCLIIDTWSTLGNYAFQYCYSLRNVIFSPQSYNFNSKTYLFKDCFSIGYLILSKNLTTLGQRVFERCCSMTSISMPSTVTTINEYAFYGCKSLVYCDFSNHTSIPTLSNTNVFTYSTPIIVVPDSLYDTWITATNWSSFSSKIVKASEYSL